MTLLIYFTDGTTRVVETQSLHRDRGLRRQRVVLGEDAAEQLDPDDLLKIEIVFK
jgi:hypothetical protein